MFFRPEEDTLVSERIDDAFGFKLKQIYVRYKDDRLAAFLLHAELQLAVDHDFHGLSAMNAFSIDDNRNVFLPQSPLHEGRRKRVNSSGRVQLFAGVKGHVMRRFINSYRVGPNNFSLVVSEQKCHMLLQVVQDGVHPVN